MAITTVQIVTDTSANVITITAATVTNTLVIDIATAAGGTITSVTDNGATGGNTWAVVPGVAGVNGNNKGWQYRAPVVKTGAAVVTVAGITCDWLRVTEMVGDCVLDQACTPGSGTNDPTTPITSPACTNTDAGALFLVGLELDSGVSALGGTGGTWISDGAFPNGNGAAHLSPGGTAGGTPSWTVGANPTWVSWGASYKQNTGVIGGGPLTNGLAEATLTKGRLIV